jgi:hypothetical protein
MARPHKNPEIWRETIFFIRKSYELMDVFPQDEKYGLTLFDILDLEITSLK